MAVIPCLYLGDPPALPELEIPQFGILQAARQSLYDLPDISTYIMTLQNAAAAALAPLRRFLELIEVILAIKNCQQAVIDALIPPSPGPIIECLKDLIEAIARLASFFPPLEYVKTALSLAKFAIQILDAIISLFELLDSRITELKVNLELAVELGDLELGAINDCAGGMTPIIVNSMDIMKFITPMLSILLDPLSRLLPIPELREMADSIANFPELLTDAQSAIEGAEGPAVLGDLIELIVQIRNIAVVMYNILAPVVGRDADLKQRTVPTLVNF